MVIQGLLCLPLKSGGFGGTFVCTGKGCVERELLLLRSRERGGLIQGLLRLPLTGGGVGGTLVGTGTGEGGRGLVCRRPWSPGRA